MSETNSPANLIVNDHNNSESSDSSMMVTSPPKSNKRKTTHDNVADKETEHVNDSDSSSSYDVQERKKRKTKKSDPVVPKRTSPLMKNIEDGIKTICGTIPWIHCVVEGSNTVEKVSLDKAVNYYFETRDEFKNCFNFIENKQTSIEFVKTHVFPLCENKLYTEDLKVLGDLEQLERHTTIQEICKFLAQPIGNDPAKVREKIRNATQKLPASVRPIARTICSEKSKIAENTFWLDAIRMSDVIFRTAYSSNQYLMSFFPLDEILGTNDGSKVPNPFIFVLSINEDTKSFNFANELAHYMLFNQYILKRDRALDNKHLVGHVYLKTQDSFKNKQQRKGILKIIKKVENDLTVKFEIFTKVIDAIASQIYVTEDGSNISRDDIKEWINAFCKDLKHPIEKTDYTFGRILLAISKIHHIPVRSHSRICIGIKNFNVSRRKKEESEMSTVDIWKALTEKAQKVEDELKNCVELIKELEEQPEVKEYKKALLEQEDTE